MFSFGNCYFVPLNPDHLGSGNGTRVYWISRRSKCRNAVELFDAASVCSSSVSGLCCRGPKTRVMAPCTFLYSHKGNGDCYKRCFTPAYPRQINSLYLAMLRINSCTVPFALTPDDEVPTSNRDDKFWDESGDVLLITTDKMAVLFQMTLLLKYSKTARSALGHIEKQLQYDIWIPIYEVACNAYYLNNVLECLLVLEKQYALLSIQSGRLI